MRNFYRHQDRARRGTGVLLLMFFVAILLMIAVTTIVVACFASLFLFEWRGELLLSPLLILGCAALVLVVVLTGCHFKASQLHRGGGAAVALQLGGRLVREAAQNSTEERQLLNIVQEIAIASGMRPPPVFVLDHDRSINAFAAGYGPQDAVVGVTRGLMTTLNRDQLQGVIAHEFSHILNGDMLLNMRALIILHGVYSIDVIGQWLIEIGSYNWDQSDGGSDNPFGQIVGALVCFACGFVLMVLGSFGTVCGLCITAAVSRQREFLADASAVEFTRHPQGIADALKVIGGFTRGSQIRSPLALEVSHMFFCAATKRFQRLLATHPPIEARIRRLDPEWDGVPLFESESAAPLASTPYQQAFSLMSAHAGPSVSAADEGSIDDVAKYLSTCTQQAYIDDVATEIPAMLRELVESAPGAAAVAASLLLHDDPVVQAEQLAWIADHYASWSEGVTRLHRHTAELDDASQLLLMDTVIERLGQNGDQASVNRQVIELLDGLCGVGGPEASTLMWCFRHALRAQLNSTPPRARYGNLTALKAEVSIMLSALVRGGQTAESAAQYAFQRAAVHIDSSACHLVGPEYCTREILDETLPKLAETSPRAKRQLVVAMGACLSADQLISPTEAELIRGICAQLCVPIPRLLPGQPVLPGT